MYRTGDRTQKFESQYEMLMAKRPCIRFFITATPVPALIALNEEEEVEDIIFRELVPCDDYVGVEDMVSDALLLRARRTKIWALTTGD